MKVIGLTGSIASGKSTVAAMLKNANVLVIDADELSRKACLPTMPALKKIVTLFGQGILKADGSLDRAKLAEIVFNDAKALKDLEDILHPAIEALRKEEIAKAEKEGREILVYMAPLLFEKNLDHLMDKTILVIAPIDLQMERIERRDGLLPQEAQKRLAFQLSNEEKIARADEIIENNGTIDDLFNKLQTVWKRLFNTVLTQKP